MENKASLKIFSCLAFVILLIFPLDRSEAKDVLNLLIWEGYAPADQVEKFERYIHRKYNRDVTLNIQYLSDPNHFYDGVRSKRIDIISPSHNLLKDNKFDFINKQLILPIDLENVPNYKNIIPPLQMADYITENGKVYGVPFAHGPYGLAYNTDKVREPDSWNVLWFPEYVNQYAISADYYEVNIYITALAMGYDRASLDNADLLDNPDMLLKLKTLIKNARSLWLGVDKAEDLAGLSLGAVWGFSLPGLKKRGEHWKIAEPKEGTIGWVDNFSICYSLKDKPFLKRIAEEWLNFVISSDFQTDVVVHGLGSDSVNRLVADRYLTPSPETGRGDGVNYLKNRVLWPILHRKRDRNLLKRLWDNASK